MARKSKRWIWSLPVLVAAMNAITCGNGGGLAPTQPAAPSEQWLLTLTIVVRNADQLRPTLQEASVWLNPQVESSRDSMERGMESSELGRNACPVTEPCGELSIAAMDRYIGPGQYRVEVKIDRQMGFVNDYLGGGSASGWTATTTTGRSLAGTFEQKRNGDCHSNEGFHWTIELD